jgi:hypothetical protein
MKKTQRLHFDNLVEGRRFAWILTPCREGTRVKYAFWPLDPQPKRTKLSSKVTR